jgi:hypothetical protein
VHGDLELAAGRLVDVVGELLQVLGVEVGRGIGGGRSHLVCAAATVATSRQRGGGCEAGEERMAAGNGVHWHSGGRLNEEAKSIERAFRVDHRFLPDRLQSRKDRR